MTSTLRVLAGCSRWTEVAGTAARAALLLAARIWLSQAVFVHGVMIMMLTGGATRSPPALETLLQGVEPLLLATGLATRPVALILLLGVGVEGAGSAVNGPRAVLLIWLVARGAGPLSIDFLMRCGLARVPILVARAINRLYADIDRLSDIILPLGTRLYLALAIAIAIAGGSGIAKWPQPISGELLTAPWEVLLLAWALLGGLATRLPALALCGVAPLMGLSGGTENGLGAMLLLLLVAACGAGRVSLDGLIARWIRAERPGEVCAGDEAPHVVVVGGGFGGIAAVRALRRVACRITLIDRRNHHLFQPRDRPRLGGEAASHHGR